MYGKKSQPDIEAINEFAARNSKQLDRLGATQEGQKVFEMIGGDSDTIKRAIAEGDTEKLAGTMKKILSTEDGAKFVDALRSMLEK